MPASQLIIRYPDRITFTLNQLHVMSEEAQYRNERLLHLLTAAQSGDPHRYLSAGIDHGMQAIRHGRRATAELNEAVTLAIRFLRSIEEHDRKVRWAWVFEELGRLCASTSISIALYYRDKLNQFAQQASQHYEALSRYMQNQWQSAAETFTRGMQSISDQVNLLGDSLRQLIDDGQDWLTQALTQAGSGLQAMLAELRQQQEELQRSASEVLAMVNGMLHGAAQQVQAAIKELHQAALELPKVIGGIIIQGSGLYFSTVSTLQKLMDQARQLGEDFAALVAQAKITAAGLVAQLLSELQRVRNEVRRLAEQLRDWAKHELMRLTLAMKSFGQALSEQVQKLKRWIVQVAEQISEWAKKLALEAQKAIQRILHFFNILIISDILICLIFLLDAFFTEIVLDRPRIKPLVKEKDEPIDPSQRQPLSDAWMYKQIPPSQSGKIKIATIGEDNSGNKRYAIFIPGTDFFDLNKTNNAFSALAEGVSFDSAYYESIVAMLLDEFPPDKAQGVEVNLYGHSLGGMVANQLPNDKRLQHLKFVSVTTYGAPRTKDSKEQPRQGVVYKNYIEREDMIAQIGRTSLDPSPYDIEVNTGDHINAYGNRFDLIAAHVDYDRSALMNSSGPSFYIDPRYIDFGDETFDGIRFKEVKEIDVGTPCM